MHQYSSYLNLFKDMNSRGPKTNFNVASQTSHQSWANIIHITNITLLISDSLMNTLFKTSDVLEHKWRASLKTILFLYE